MTLPKVIWQFDLLRGLAVLAVMLFHISHNLRSSILPRLFGWGWAGVDLFFVLSGFLITGILITTVEDPCYFRNFYARRILRIWPLYFTLLAAFMLVLPLVAPRLAAPSVETAYPRWTYLVFMQNFIRHKVLGPLSVTWSLALEEQFYIVWPLLVWLLTVRRLKLLLFILILSGPVVGCILTYSEVHFNFNNVRIDGLSAGSLLAILVQESDAVRIRKIGFWLLILSFIGMAAALSANSTWPQFFLLAAAFGSILCLSITTSFIPGSRFLCYTGRISYGLYLWHLPSFDLVRSDHLRALLPNLPIANDLCYILLAFAVAYILAGASWIIMERPILRLRRHFRWSGAAEFAHTS